MNLEFRYRFEAAHRFLKSSSIPCMTPHGHTWFATLNLKFKGAALDNSQMTVEFSKLKKSWKELIQETFDHSYMHNINDPVVEVLSSEKNKARLIPFPGDPTTEMISLFMFQKMETVINNSDFKEKVEVTSIKLEETPTNSIICDRAFYTDQIGPYLNSQSWWNKTEIQSRDFQHNG